MKRKTFLEEREKAKAAKEKEEARKNYAERSAYNGSERNGKNWWDREKNPFGFREKAKEEIFDNPTEEDLQEEHEALMTKMLAYNVREGNSFVAVLDVVLKRLTPNGEVSDLQLDYISKRIIEEAPKIISEFEGGHTSEKYIAACINDLVEELMKYVNPEQEAEDDPLQQLISSLEEYIEIAENEQT